MKTIQERMADLIEQASAMIDAAKKEERDLTAEEQTKYDGLLAEFDNLKVQAERENSLATRKGWLSQPASAAVRPDPTSQHGFSSFGEFLQAVVRAESPQGRVDPRLVEERATGMSEGIPAEGGFLVGVDYVNELLKKTYETGILAGRCRKIPVSANSNGIKMPYIKETSRADGSRWGGILAYWKGEAAAKAASQPEIGQIELNLKKLTGLAYVTDELLQDTAALEAYVSQAFVEEFAFKIDDAIFNGTGAGMPLGIMNSPCLVTVAKETGQAAKTIVFENIVNMWSRMWAKSRPNAVWLINQDIEPQLYSLGITVGTGGSPVYLPPGGLSGSPYGTLFGRPVIPIEQAQTLGTVGDIALADFSQYILIDKGGIQAASSIHVKFIYDETVFRFVYRVDGQPWWPAALTPKNSTNTLSPFVVLATRA